MLHLKRYLLLLCFSLLYYSHLNAQIVQVGSGSYTTSFPGTDEAGRNGFPGTAPLVSGVAATKPIPTNDWWSSLLKNDIFGGGNDFAKNLFNYPISMQTKSSGLVVSYIPFGVFDDQEPIVIGVSGLSVSNTSVSDFSDWTVTMNWNDRFQATSGIGMPFIYFEKGSAEVASVTINLGNVTVSDEMILVTDARNGADFAIYAPLGSTWSQNGSSYTSTLNGNDFWSMAMLPQGESNASAIAEEYKKYAYVFPSNTSVAWAYDESSSVVTTDFTVEVEVKEGTHSNVLMGLLPHQWAHLADDSPSPMEYTYNSVRGDLKTLVGNSFKVERTFHGILPTLPYLTNYSDGFSLSDLHEKVELLKNDQLATWTDSYNEGQVMNRLIQTARIAHEMGNFEARDKMIATIKERLEDWLTAEVSEVAFLFYYHSAWTALLGYPSGHGQDTNINDHHFHWGYFIHAAAFLEQFEPGWSEQWGDMINLLVRDAASPDREDELFPFLRNFSPYAGHCWANGMAAFPQGNDQESTSESMQFNSSLIHWGAVTGNDEIRDLGIYLYTTEQAAVEEYWFDINERIFPQNQYSLVSRVWGNSYDNGTFWTNDIAASYGIELYPIHGGSMYLGHNIEYAEKLWTEIEGNTGILNNEENPNLWHDIMWQYLSFTDPAKAIILYNSYPDRELKFGVSDAQTYYWLHSMNAIGQVDATITADYPIAVAFLSGDDHTYVAHNYTDAEIDVTFSDGYVLTVPAHQMATNRDVSISGVLTSSFQSAYPGGSVVLSVDVEDATPTKVEFYDDGVYIGEDLSAPFTIVAEHLSASVHGFYAKVFDESEFGVTNIVSVVVGDQLPFPGAPSTIPGTIEAGHYDYFEGGKGQGITYSDVSPNNEGDFRLDESVGSLLSEAEGATVGWINGGEWIEYTVSVDQSGLYEFSFRFASGNQAGGGPFYLELDGYSITEAISLGYTGDWDSWQTMSVSGVAMAEGEHSLRLNFDNGEFNLGRMTFEYQGALPYSQPVANAGANLTVILPETTATLDGSLSFDAEDELTFEWEQIYGPSVITFSDKSVAITDVSNLEEGVYKCTLTVSDGEYFSSDQVLIIVSEDGNVDPTVSITSPANNSTFKEGAVITITASASDLEEDITRVEFFADDTKLGEDTSAPYSFEWMDAAIGQYVLTAVVIDGSGGEGISLPITIQVDEVAQCTETSSDALEGAFSTGYKVTFESVGSNVAVTFELLDTDKVGVVAYLWQEAPFSEVQMDHVSGTTFTKTLTGLNPGTTISVACKFAFAGGLAVTKYLQYEVGGDCEGSSEDTTKPVDFSATIGTISANSIDLILNGSDNSGKVIYEATYGSTTKSLTVNGGDQGTLTVSGLASETAYSFSVVAKDQAGNVAENSPIVIGATTLENSNSSCSGTSIAAQQGSFDSGYTYEIETSGTDVHISFELLDAKEGVVAYLWRPNPFSESSMTNVSGKKFSVTLSNQTPGATISFACKFAFAGGLAVTTYLEYEVGDDCESSEEITPPVNFSISLGDITTSSIELLLNAKDDSGNIVYTINDGETDVTINGESEVVKSHVITGLNSSTQYSFVVTAEDPSGTPADNNPISLSATTLEEEEETVLNLESSRFAIRLYPNPVKNSLTISGMKLNSVSVYSLSGQRLLTTISNSVDMSKLKSGIYLLTIEKPDGEEFQTKILKE